MQPADRREDSTRPSPSQLVSWLRAPAFAPNVFRLRRAQGFFGRLTLAVPVLLGLIALALLLIRTTETYISNNGIGDDGIYYASILRAYDGNVRHIPSLGLNAYMAQRCLNPILVRIGMNLFHMPTDDRSIIAAYKVANATSIVIAMACFTASLRHLRLSRAGFLVGMTFATVNFMVLYWLPFDPVVVDAMTLAVGSVQIWAYLSRRYLVLAVASAIGGFIWPSAAQVGAAMLFFPRSPEDAEPATAPSDRDGPGAIDLAIAAIASGVVTWYASTLADYAPPYGQLPAAKTLFRLSCVLWCFLTFFGLKELVRVVPSLRQFIRRDFDAIAGKVLAVMLLFGMSRAIHWISTQPTNRLPQNPVFAVSDVIKGSVFFAVQRPLIPLFAHVGYLGAAILVFVWCWRRTCNEARRLGFGINAALGMAFFLLFNSQSRAGTDLFPIVVPLATLAAARLPWTPRRLLELGALSVIASKLWYSIVQKPRMDIASIMDHIGPWMSNDAYVAHGVLFVGASIWLLWMSRQKAAPHEVVRLTEDQPT